MDALVAWLEEALAPVGTVSSRRMMGGHTVYLDGTVFAIVAADELWFKADAQSDAAWDAAGCERFTYARKDGTTGTMNYRRAPAETYDDPDALRERAALAVAAGRRGPAKRSRAKRV